MNSVVINGRRIADGASSRLVVGDLTGERWDWAVSVRGIPQAMDRAFREGRAVSSISVEDLGEFDDMDSIFRLRDQILLAWPSVKSDAGIHKLISQLSPAVAA